MPPAISVIIPLYNKQAYIKRAIDSVLNQTFDNLELIIVNDGSTDASMEIVKSINDTRIRMISQPNQGPGSARNAGISAANSEILAFLDADDEWLPDYLAAGFSIFSSNIDIAAVTQNYYENQAGQNNSKYWKIRGLSDGINNLTPESLPFFANLLWAYMKTWSTMITRDAIQKYGGFYDRYKALYGEDAYLMLKILLNEKVYISFSPNVIYHHEASDLSKITGHPQELQPYFQDPQKLFEFCPIEFQKLLGQILSIRAVKRAKEYALFGDTAMCKQLSQKFRQNGFLTNKWLEVSALTKLAPIFPLVRKILHGFKKSKPI